MDILGAGDVNLVKTKNACILAAWKIALV